MQFLIDFCLCVLAVYRLAYLIAYEDGPFDLASSLRERVGQTSWIGRGFNCALCISFWLSAIAALYLAGSVAHDVHSIGVQFFWDWFAVAGAALLFHKVIKRL